MENYNQPKKVATIPSSQLRAPQCHPNQQLSDFYNVDYDSNGFQISNKNVAINCDNYLNKIPKYFHGMNPNGYSRVINQNGGGSVSAMSHKRFGGYCDFTDIKSNSMDSSYFAANFKSDPKGVEPLVSTFADNQNNLSLNWSHTYSLPSCSLSNEQPSIDSISPLPSFIGNAENESFTSSSVVARQEPSETPSKPSRSMIALCEMFLKQYTFESSDQPICPNVLSQDLNIERRRVYDLINILAGLDLIKKAGRGCCYWGGLKLVPRCLMKIKHRLNSLVTNNYNINNRDDKSISYMARRFLALMMSIHEPIDIEQASMKLYPGIFHEKINSSNLEYIPRTPKNYGSKRFSYEFAGFERVEELYCCRSYFNQNFDSLACSSTDRFNCESNRSFDSSRYYATTHSDDQSYSIEGLIGGCGSSNLSTTSSLATNTTNQLPLSSIESNSTKIDNTDRKLLVDYSITKSKCGLPAGSSSPNPNQSNDVEFKENLAQLLTSYTPIKRKLLCDRNCNY